MGSKQNNQQRLLVAGWLKNGASCLTDLQFGKLKELVRPVR